MLSCIFSRISPNLNIPRFTFPLIRTMANYRHKKMVKLAKGYRGRANRCFTVAKQRVEKALQYAYRDRRVLALLIRTYFIYF
jgi:ribosomal protein L20